MVIDLLVGLLVSVGVLVLPGYFWARGLFPSDDRVETLAYTMALSSVLVPSTALLLMFSTGYPLTLEIALGAVLAVAVLGLLAYRLLGQAKGDADPADVTYSDWSPLLPSALIPLLVASVVLLDGNRNVLPGRWYPLGVALLLLATVILHVRGSRQVPPDDTAPTQTPLAAPPDVLLGRHTGWRRRLAPVLCFVLSREFLVAAVLLLSVLRAYIGPVLHNWPYARGEDLYAHAIMSDLVLTTGSAQSYSIYPPGFHILTGVLSRLSGLEPLALYTVLAPSLMLLPALACYVLATAVFGRETALPAAAFGGLLLPSPLNFINNGTYVDLIAAEFLLVLSVTSLLLLAARPSLRTALLPGLLGSGVVLYHTLSTLYMLLLLGMFSVLVLPYALRRNRRLLPFLALAFTILGGLAVAYAWNTYDLLQTVNSLLGRSRASTSVGVAATVVGSQAPIDVFRVPAFLSQTVAWLGLLGLLLLAFGLRRRGLSPSLPVLLLLGWVLIFFVASRTTWSGFPVRFLRDMGLPLSVVAAYAFVRLLRSYNPARVPAVLAVGTMTLVVVLNSEHSFVGASRTQGFQVVSPEIAAASEWLRQNYEGGNVVTNPLVWRAVHALSDAPVLPAITEDSLENGRGVYPSGRQQVKDIRWLYEHSIGWQTRNIIRRYDIRYLVFVKRMPDNVPRSLREEAHVRWGKFRSQPTLYETVYENDRVVIYKPVPQP